MLPATAEGPVGRVLGNASHGYTASAPMIEMRRMLGGCCNRGVKTTDGAPVFVSSSS